MGIGKKLAELIEQKGTNANELAENTGITPSTIYSIIKRDNTKVDIGVLIRICEALDVDVEVFYQEYMKNKTVSRQNMLSPSFVEKYCAIDEHGKKIVDTVLNLEYERCSENINRGILISGNSEKAIARSSNKTYMDPPTPEQEAAAEEITDDEFF